MSTALTALAASAVILTVVVGVILTYHWVRYSMNTTTTMLTLIVYVGVSAFLALLLFAAAAASAPAI